MAQTNSGIGVTGVVVGLILGAGAMLYTQGYSLQAQVVSSDLVAYRGLTVDAIGDYKRRTVRNNYDQQRSSLIRTRTPSRPTKTISPTRTVTPVPQKTVPTVMPLTGDCAIKVGAVEVAREKVLSLIPRRGSLFSLHVMVDNAFNESIEDCVSPTVQKAVQPVQRMNAKPKPRVNNHCEQYQYGSPRYTKCVVNERQGQRYQGRQTTLPR